MTNNKIRNLELNLISEDEGSMIGKNEGEFKILGKRIIRKYTSLIGNIEIHELLDNKGKRKVYFFIEYTGLKSMNKLYKEFYGCKVMPAMALNREETNQVNELTSKY